MIVADTDVLIDFLRGKGDMARRVALELRSRSFGTTAITAFELRSGVRSPRHAEAVETLLDAMTVLPFGPEESAIAARIRREVERKGSPIGMADYLIAATCMSRNAVLLTRNVKHFERVAGLRLSGRYPGTAVAKE